MAGLDASSPRHGLVVAEDPAPAGRSLMALSPSIHGHGLHGQRRLPRGRAPKRNPQRAPPLRRAPARLFREGASTASCGPIRRDAAALLALSAVNWAYTWLAPGRDTDALADSFAAILIDGIRGSLPVKSLSTTLIVNPYASRVTDRLIDEVARELGAARVVREHGWVTERLEERTDAIAALARRPARLPADRIALFGGKATLWSACAGSGCW